MLHVSEPADDEISEIGWEPVAGVDGPLDEVRLQDLGLLAEVTHPVRGPLLRRLKEPRTVAELAALLDVPVTRLYHHIHRLDELGLIRVVATRRVAAVTERRYQVIARSYRLADELFDADNDRELAIALGSLFDVAKLDLQREVELGRFRNRGDRDEHSTLSLGELNLSPERHRTLIRRLQALVDELGSDASEADADAVRVTLFVAAFPSSR